MEINQKIKSWLVRKFNGRTKKTTQKIDNYNAEWIDALRILESNGMILPDKYIVNVPAFVGNPNTEHSRR